mmetsp:Transcript_10989/g.12068  ORF Transcript_10989/g.12068 Transcript_10989/m.12068 type:complete len:442 (-) Transcript_10989:160-1485(-)
MGKYSTNNCIQNLELLKRLLDQGIIDVSEFNSRKAQIINESTNTNYNAYSTDVEMVDQPTNQGNLFDSVLPPPVSVQHSTVFAPTNIGHDTITLTEKQQLCKKILELSPDGLQQLMNLIHAQEPGQLMRLEDQEWSFDINLLTDDTVLKIRTFVENFYTPPPVVPASVGKKRTFDEFALYTPDMNNFDFFEPVLDTYPFGNELMDLDINDVEPVWPNNPNPPHLPEPDVDPNFSNNNPHKRFKYTDNLETVMQDIPPKTSMTMTATAVLRDEIITSVEPMAVLNNNMEVTKSIEPKKEPKKEPSPTKKKRTIRVKVRIYDLRQSRNGEKFNCPSCTKSFNDSSNLLKHIRIHTREKPYLCNICGKCFAHSSTLKGHTNIHLNKKPFTCTFNGCNKSFSNSSNLSRHKRVHTGEKPYACSICNKKFNQSSNLKQHQKTHDPN